MILYKDKNIHIKCIKHFISDKNTKEKIIKNYCVNFLHKRGRWPGEGGLEDF